MNLHLACLAAVVPVCLAGAPLPAAAAPQAPAPAASFATTMARYRELLDRRAVLFHTRGRELLAATQQPEALTLLVQDFDKVKDHAEHARYTLASLFLRDFDDARHLPTLQRLCAKAKDPVDTWLHQNVLTVTVRQLGVHDVLQVFERGHSVHEQAAAIAALGDAHSLGAFEAIARAVAALPPKNRKAERCLLVGAMAHAVFAQRSHVRDGVAREGMTAFLHLLDPDVELPAIARHVVANELFLALGGPAPLQETAHWERLLAQDERAPADGDVGPTRSVGFFGLATFSERCCFVLDLSDSMCRPIDATAKALRSGGDDDLPWASLHTRFDLARAHLVRSLRQLTPDQSFAVITFGSDATNLECCPGLVRATRANVQRAIAELMAIEVGHSAGEAAPFGTLRGQTNLHFALRRALSLTSRGYVATAAYVDPDVLTSGCDTVFVLTDGAPSWDEFELVERNYGDDPVVANAEYAAPMGGQDQLHYFGPYDSPAWLVDDVHRMNTFLSASIHCLGIGEANVDLLRWLTDNERGMLWVDGARLERSPGAVR